MGAFFFSFHIWICFNAFIQMHLRYCPTVTSQFTIKIRFCFLPSLSFPTFLAWVECSVGKAVCMQIRATQGELSHGSAATGTLCSPPGGGQEGPLLSAIWNYFCLANKPFPHIRQAYCSFVIISGCSCSSQTAGNVSGGDNCRLQDDKRKMPATLLWADMVAVRP